MTLEVAVKFKNQKNRMKSLAGKADDLYCEVPVSLHSGAPRVTLQLPTSGVRMKTEKGLT